MSGQPKQQSSTQRERQAYRVPQSSTEQRKAHLVSDLERDTSDSDSEAVPDQQHAEFYDSGADEKDEAYIHKERQGRQSDAILSCPGCLTTVCIDCQRHEYITTQYRAMFVRNCRVSPTPKSSTLSKQQKTSGKRQWNSQHAQSATPIVQEQVFPVTCETCNAELGVQDAEEIFHFYSVFPSTA